MRKLLLTVIFFLVAGFIGGACVYDGYAREKDIEIYELKAKISMLELQVKDLKTKVAKNNKDMNFLRRFLLYLITPRPPYTIFDDREIPVKST